MESTNGLRRTLTWDEEAIAEHDKERGTRQKIIEPPTPYAYCSDEDDDENSEQVGPDETRETKVMTRFRLAAPKVMESKEELNAKLKFHQFTMERKSDEPVEENSAQSEDKKAAFAEKRAFHYNEFKMIQALRNRRNDDDEDYDDEEEVTHDKPNTEDMDIS
jgi:hypothetical protein